MSLIIDTTNVIKDKINEFITTKGEGVNLPTLNDISNTLTKINGELQSRLCVYLNPRSVELCSKLIYAIPITLVLNTLTIPQTIVISLIGGACLWSCKKEFLTKDSKINLLHSIAIVFFANIISYTTEFSMALFLRLPVNAALLTGSLLLADQLEGKIKHEPKEQEIKLELQNTETIEIIG